MIADWKRPPPTDFPAVIIWVEKEVARAGRKRRLESSILAGRETPYWSDVNALKRAVYAHMEGVVKMGQLDRLKKFVTKRDGAAAWANANPFVWELRLVQYLDAASTPSDRAKFAVQMLYAHKHRIRPSLLAVFLAIADSYESIRLKLAADHEEKWSKYLRAEVKRAKAKNGSKNGSSKVPE